MHGSVPLLVKVRFMVLILKVASDLMRMRTCMGRFLGSHRLLADIGLHEVLSIPVLIGGLYLDIIFLILEHQCRRVEDMRVKRVHGFVSAVIRQLSIGFSGMCLRQIGCL